MRSETPRCAATAATSPYAGVWFIYFAFRLVRVRKSKRPPDPTLLSDRVTVDRWRLDHRSVTPLELKCVGYQSGGISPCQPRTRCRSSGWRLSAATLARVNHLPLVCDDMGQITAAKGV